MSAPNPPIIDVSKIDFNNLLFCIPLVIPIIIKANNANPISFHRSFLKKCKRN